MRVWWTPLRAMKAVSEWYEAKSDEELIIALGHKLNPELFQKRWPNLEALLNDYLVRGFNIYDPETGKSFKSAGRSKAGMVEVDDVYTDYWRRRGADGNCTFDYLVKEQCCYEYDDFCATYYKYEKGPAARRRATRLLHALRPHRAGAVRHVRRVGHPAAGRACEVAFHQAPLGGRGVPLRVPLHLHQRQPLLRVLPFREPPAEDHARVPPVAHRAHQPAGRGRQRHRGRAVDLAGEHRGPLQAEGAHRPMLDPHYVHAEHAWWFPEQEPAAPHLYGSFDCNINNLTTSYETGFGGIGNPLKAPVCKIYPVTPENEEPSPARW